MRGRSSDNSCLDSLVSRIEIRRWGLIILAKGTPIQSRRYVWWQVRDAGAEGAEHSILWNLNNLPYRIPFSRDNEKLIIPDFYMRFPISVHFMQVLHFPIVYVYTYAIYTQTHTPSHTTHRCGGVTLKTEAFSTRIPFGLFRFVCFYNQEKDHLSIITRSIIHWILGIPI